MPEAFLIDIGTEKQRRVVAFNPNTATFKSQILYLN